MQWRTNNLNSSRASSINLKRVTKRIPITRRNASRDKTLKKAGPGEVFRIKTIFLLNCKLSAYEMMTYLILHKGMNSTENYYSQKSIRKFSVDGGAMKRILVGILMSRILILVLSSSSKI